MRPWRSGPRRASSTLARTGRDGSRQTSSGPRWGRRATSAGLCRSKSPASRSTPVVLNMGNPQCVLLGPLPDEQRFRRLGAALERHAMFPEGTNVEFAQVEAPDRVRILIWERGVGPTSSSGTGSCAALVAAASFGGAARDAEVDRARRGPARRVARRQRLPDRLGRSALRGRVAAADSAYRVTATAWQFLTAAFQRPTLGGGRGSGVARRSVVAALERGICGGGRRLRPP